MPKHFIIHVGPHKTGTTYLQTTLVQFRGELSDRGIFYPPWWGPVAHYDLLDMLQRPGQPELIRQFGDLRRLDHDTIVLSVEGLVNLGEEGVRFLADLVRDARVTVIFYARSWAAVLASTWREMVKEGSVTALPEFLFTRIANPLDASELNFMKGLDTFAASFGKGAINIVAYDTIMAERGDTWKHFAREFLHWEDAPMPSVRAANVSLGPKETETIRAINAIEAERRGGHVPSQFGLAMTASYLTLKDELGLEGVWDRQDMFTANITLDETTPNLRTVHRQIYDRYVDRLIPPRPPRMFFTPRSVKIPYVRPDYLFDQNVGRTLIEAHARIINDVAMRKGTEDGMR